MQEKHYLLLEDGKILRFFYALSIEHAERIVEEEESADFPMRLLEISAEVTWP